MTEDQMMVDEMMRSEALKRAVECATAPNDPSICDVSVLALSYIFYAFLRGDDEAVCEPYPALRKLIPDPEPE